MKTHGPCPSFKVETDPSKIDFDKLASDVAYRICILKATWGKVPEQILVDLYVPAIRHLARFCAAIEIGEPRS